jgi:predicted transcriptional regulator
LLDARKKVEELEQEVSRLKQATFGEVTAEEDIAKKFFSELALSSEQVKSSEKELQEKKSLLDQAQKSKKEAMDSFLKSLTTMRFPLKLGSEGIEKKGNTVIFYFGEELDKGLLDEIRNNLESDCFSSSKVEIHGDKIIAKGFDDVSEAMKEVMSHVETKIWKVAGGILEVDKYVLELRTRDEKIQKMLYVLSEAGKPLTKKEMEALANLQPGDLRGVLYIVLKRDPYLREGERGQYYLTEIGKRIMQRYKEKYPSPIHEETETIPKEAENSKTLRNFIELKKEETKVE